MKKPMLATPQEIYSKIEPRSPRYRCADCGWGADAPMLKDNVWLSIARKDEVLCIGCTERRLNRRLLPVDFRRCLMNGAALYFLERYLV